MKNILVFSFIAMVGLQLFVPANMVFQQEEILKTGKAFRFKTAPIDPNDPFRGRYVSLSFEANTFESPTIDDWLSGEPAFVLLEEDREGFAKIKDVVRTEPPKAEDFVPVKVRTGWFNAKNKIRIEYPFNKFFMEETKAPDAEIKVREAQRDSTQVAWAVVRVKGGQAVLEDVKINGVPLKDWVEEEELDKKE